MPRDFFSPVSDQLDRIRDNLAVMEQQIRSLLKLLFKPSAPVTNLEVKRNLAMSTATLSWTNPTTRIDGSALAPTDIASINVFDADSPTPDTPIGIVLPGGGQVPTTFMTAVLAPGNHSFTVVVNDTAGHASAPSNAATLTVAEPAPSPATGLTATLILTGP
jgi:hypothetical protein